MINYYKPDKETTHVTNSYETRKITMTGGQAVEE